MLRRDSIHLLVLVALCLVGCRRPPTEATAPARFSVHEWGLFAVDTASAGTAVAATGTSGELLAANDVEGRSDPSGLGTIGAKPVLYVHLDPGVADARFDLHLGVATESLLERWPAGGQLDANAQRTKAGWRSVGVRAGACAHPTEPPTAASVACTSVRDGFCEAVEIPRYAGGSTSCLAVGAEQTELLFYRAGALPTARLPLHMVQRGDRWVIERRGDAELVGPVFWLTTAADGSDVRVRRLGMNDFGRPLDDTAPGAADPERVRADLLEEAVRRGLSAMEAEAFVDAWSPAFFARARRTGPSAIGTTPTALRQSRRSLVYFAPESVVDAMLPLSTNPPARAIHRVFLVRFVDGSALLPERPWRPIPPSASGRPRRPVARLDSRVMVNQGLSADQVRRVVQRNSAQIQDCYEQSTRTEPALEGRITVEFVVLPTGNVGTSSITNESTAAPELEACITRAVQRWAFPSPDPAVVARARASFDLSLEEVEP